MSAALRVCVLGVSHYHTPIYIEAALEAGLRITGVADPSSSLARRVAADLGCEASTDAAELCRRQKPDFVIAFAPHRDMPALGSSLVAEGIPFMLEKPCGIESVQVDAVAQAAAKKGVFAAVPFVWRHSHIAQRLRSALVGGDRLHYLIWRYIAGPPSRYTDSNSGWMLDPVISGGGATINLAVHFIDLFRWLAGSEPEVTAARMSSSRWGLDVEDESLLVLETGSAMCTIETGYHSSGATGQADLLWSATTDREHMVATSLFDLKADSFDGRTETITVPRKAFPYYVELIESAVARLCSGQPPEAGLADMAAVLRCVEKAYDMARSSVRAPD